MTIAEVDQLVVQDDSTAARLWPRLGPKVRAAYLADRDAWTVLRRRVDEGRLPTDAAIAAKHRAFTGWARAFRAAGRHHHTSASRPARAVAARLPRPGAAAAALAVSPSAMPSIAHGANGGAGTAIAGGIVLAGLVALAARRKRP